MFEDDLPFPKVGYIDSLEGNPVCRVGDMYSHHVSHQRLGALHQKDDDSTRRTTWNSIEMPVDSVQLLLYYDKIWLK